MLNKIVKFTTKSGYEIQPENNVIKLKGNKHRLNTMYFEIAELIRFNKEAMKYDLGQAILRPDEKNGWKLNKEWRIK